MENFEYGLIFEDMESMYDELEGVDGKYLPHSKHDKQVKEATMSEFNMSAKEVDEVFSAFSKRATDSELRRLINTGFFMVELNVNYAELILSE